jgi:hypothetical protein
LRFGERTDDDGAVERAALLIGVDKAGDLQPLQDAAAGARKMEEWARGQGIPTVEVLTDEAGPVDIGDVKRAIQRIIELGSVSHLLVYFAGHGVNANYSEMLLLSDAPGDPQAAINVRGTVELARDGGRIPYVVLISDACRTAATGIRFQRVKGSEIFRNDEVGGGSRTVDQFFACRLGSPANEVRADPTASYRAIYTSTLLTALRGDRPVVPADARYIRPRPLRDFLAREMERLINDDNLPVDQEPDAVLASDDDAWVGELPPGRPAPGRRSAAPPGPTQRVSPRARLTHSLLGPLLLGDVETFRSLRGQAEAGHPSVSSFSRAVASDAEPFGPEAHETACGFKLRGARFAEAFAANATTERLDAQVIRVAPRGGAPNVLLVLDDGRGLSLPALPGFLGSITVQDDEVVSVAYEPSRNTARWPEFVRRADDIRALRALAATASRDGVFQLGDTDEPDDLAHRLRYAKSLDPALAVYASYAYADLGRREVVADIARIMSADLGAPLFDIALLARGLTGERIGHDTSALSFMPMLAQGWALLNAHRIAFTGSLEGIDRHVLPSLWTLLDEGGVAMVRQALTQGEIR